MWLEALSAKFYKNKEALGLDILNALKLSLDKLTSSGAV